MIESSIHGNAGARDRAVGGDGARRFRGAWAFLGGLCLLLQLVAAAGEAANPLISYQGKLWRKDTDDTRLPYDGDVNLVFKICTQASGGTCSWTETHNAVSVQKGVFEVVLGNTTALPVNDTALEGGRLYLEVSVNGTVLVPREQLNHALFAVRARTVEDNAITADKIAAAVAGSGLSGGGGSALAVSVDGATLEISSDTLRIKDLGIGTAKIAEGAVTAAKLGAGAVGEAALGTGAVTTAEIKDGTIANIDIATNAAVDPDKLAGMSAGEILVGDGTAGPGAVSMSGDATLVASGTLTITAGAVGSSEIIDASVATADLADGAVTTAKIADGTITGADVNGATSITTTGTVTAGTVTGATVTGTTVSGTTVNATGTLKIGGTAVAATAAELNQVADGVSAGVTAANLSALTGGADTALHAHDARYFTEPELEETASGLDGARLIGFQDAAFAATTVHDAIGELMTGGTVSKTLQSAYADGNAIVATGGDGELAVSDAETGAFDTLTVSKTGNVAGAEVNAAAIDLNVSGTSTTTGTVTGIDLDFTDTVASGTREGINVQMPNATDNALTTNAQITAGTVVAALTGNVTGNVTGDVTGNAGTATALAANGGNCATGNAPLGVDALGAAEACYDVATQAELTAHTGASAAHAATSLNTANAIVARDAAGNFAAGTITGSFSGNATTATAAGSFTGTLAGDVTGPQGTTSVDTVGGATAANVASGAAAANAATDANTPNTIVKRDASGNFAAGTITGSFSGNAT
ncbi:MAG: hypothetical protein HYV63_21715, partial [Candidatus Schekmanbacteria bacterium]|nr:hypothetical protein [Candidatus Schekmanbacteria bacterium]